MIVRLRTPRAQTPRPPQEYVLSRTIKTETGRALLLGNGSLIAKGVRPKYGKAVLTGTGTLVARSTLTVKGKAILSGTGTLLAHGRRTKKGKALLAGLGTLLARGFPINKAGPPNDAVNDFTQVNGHKHVEPRKTRGWNR